MVGGSERLKLEYDSEKVSIQALHTGADGITISYIKQVWLINLGTRKIVFTPTVSTTTTTDVMMEFSVRAHAYHTDPSWYETLVMSPIKLMQETLEAVLDKSVMDQAEPLAVFYVKKITKAGEDDL